MPSLFEQLNAAKREEEKANSELAALHEKGIKHGENIEKLTDNINSASDRIKEITQLMGQFPRE